MMAGLMTSGAADRGSTSWNIFAIRGRVVSSLKRTR